MAKQSQNNGRDRKRLVAVAIMVVLAVVIFTGINRVAPASQSARKKWFARRLPA